MAHDLDLQLLRTFVAILDTGGLTRAGKKIGRTQPAISHQIGRLEERLGRPLFAAGRRHRALTRDGEVLLEYARALLKLNDEAIARLSNPDLSGHVTLGTPDLYAAYMLPEVLASFSHAHPNVEINLHCRRSVHLRSALEQGDLDLALLTNQPSFQRGEVVRTEPVIWVAGKNGQAERGDPLPLAMLPNGSVYRSLALEGLHAIGREWSIRSVCDSIAGLLAAVLAGLAVSAFPRCALNPGLRALSESDGLPALPAVEIVLHRRPGGLSPAAAQLADYMARELASEKPRQGLRPIGTRPIH